MSEDIRLDMRITDLLEMHPETEEVFEAHGLGGLVTEEARRVLGPFLTVETALRSRKIAPENFLGLLRGRAHEEKTLDAPGLEAARTRGAIRLLALMPCGLKVPFSRALTSFLDDLAGGGDAAISHAVEGNLNQELSYYTYAGCVENLGELPDLIVCSDFNAFYFRRFYERFIKTGCFVDPTDYEPNALFKDTGIPDPEGGCAIIGVNPLIIVADLEKVGDRPLPRRWTDLFDPMWRKSITLRGNDRFFCHAVLLPLYKENGAEGIAALAHNVLNGWHPSQMVKAIGTASSAALYVMPDFFAHKIPDRKAVRFIWPEDGALASPVTLLVKKDKAEALKPVTDYLLGAEMAKVFAGALFPTPRPDVPNQMPPGAGLKWIGWDYIRGNDLEKVNAEIDATFLPIVFGENQ
ncbi:MAG: ABC transporter substrate-binding protein [Syntrophobacteraceae bacterium]